VWAAILELNVLRQRRSDVPVVSYQALCRELSLAGPGCAGELSSLGARSILRRYSDAWFSANAARRGGDASARYPRRRRALMPSRYHAGTFVLDDLHLSLPMARGCPPLALRLSRPVPYPPGTVRLVTLLSGGPKLFVDVTAEVPVATYEEGLGPEPARVAGVDLGIIHPYAVASAGAALLVSGAGHPRPETWSGGVAALATVPGQVQTARRAPPAPSGPGQPRSGPGRRRLRRRSASAPWWWGTQEAF
jgi:hypothetical protein